MKKLILKKARANVPQLLGLVLLLTVGAGFYITLFTILSRYEETALQFFADYQYADATIFGVFDAESVRHVAALDGVTLARGRTVYDFREDERIFRAVSLTDGINIPHIYEGRLPADASEIAILRRNAEAMGYSIGDNLTIGGETLAITGLVASPEYVYLVQSALNLMASADVFGVVFVAAGFFPPGYSEIVVLGELPPAEIGGVVVLREQQINYNLFREDMGQIRTFALIFPLVFAVLIAVVIYVMLSRTVQKDRKQIGTMKALGVSDTRIIGIYLSQFCFAAIAGAVLGGAAAVVLTDFIVGIMSAMFEVPGLGFAFYPWLWVSAFVVAVALCAASGLAALSAILPLLPAHAMRPRLPKGGRRLLIERAEFLWKRFSFNTRYALKNSLRNKGRFAAVVLGMCGTCALLTFSLGFNDSIANTQEIYFAEFVDEEANLDAIMASVETLTFFMIGCAVILGFTVLYSVGLINLSAREYEYMFMGVMGYSSARIFAAHIKETAVQLALAIPLGFIAGNLLLEAIRDEFSTDNFVIRTAIFSQSYVIAAAVVVAVTALMAGITLRHIERLDIVEGLKAQDD